MIGGMFPLEKIGEVSNREEANTIYAMSGRCALYACLMDMDIKGEKIAYVPAYTCETVLSSYLKAGFSLRFYDIDPTHLTPLFKEEDLEGVSVMGICGYFGFVRYDHDFNKRARERGIEILLDTTHSPLYVEKDATYSAGSLRKWMGIASGGVAVKHTGPFKVQLKECEKEHIEGRYRAMEERQIALDTGDDSYNEKAGETFWNTELRLRRIFDLYASDDISIAIIKHFDFNDMREKRRANFNTIIEHLDTEKGWKAIYCELEDDDVPSHFSLYADNRDDMRAFLEECGVKSTVFWPNPPMLDDVNKYSGARYIYDHIMSIQLDQRYSKRDMIFLSNCLNEYSSRN